MKKNQILYAEFGYGIEKFRIVDVKGDNWVAKEIGLDIYIFSSQKREIFATQEIKKWWQFWLD